MSLARITWVVGFVSLGLQAGCSSRPTSPAVTSVDFSVAASAAEGSPAQPVMVDAVARNTGNTPVWHCQGCGCGNGINLSVLGPDGVAVLLRDPNEPWPLCPDGPVQLEPGGAVAARVVFTGTLYPMPQPGIPSTAYPAPAGSYTVVAHFHYGARASERIPIEQRASFAWQP